MLVLLVLASFVKHVPREWIKREIKWGDYSRRLNGRTKRAGALPGEHVGVALEEGSVDPEAEHLILEHVLHVGTSASVA